MTSDGHQDQQPWTPPTAPTMPMAPAVPARPTVPIAHTAPMAPPTLSLPGPNTANQPTIKLDAPTAGELLRFGPGVPVPARTADLSQAAAIWRGEAQPVDGDAARRRQRRRLISWLLPILVLIAVLAILLWQRSGSSLTVTDAAVRAASPSLACDGTATVTATIHINGADGTITYRWRRSDGTASDTLRQQTTKGATDVHVVLLWSFHGRGSMNATATLEVLSPSRLSASTTFAYSCP
ncbi:MAG TPA: hypothetical protein VFU74_00130 [Actinocrinis sp.]|nr:hypothetical protein [Actinocrinis sp.]